VVCSIHRDGQGGENDGQVRVDRVALAVVDRPGPQVVFGHSERLLKLDQPVAGVDDELGGDGGAVRAGGQVGHVALQPATARAFGL
jgi:hypothetical protein